MSLIVNNVATFWSVNGGLIIPPFAKSIGRMLCNKLIIPVTNRVINNKGSKLGNIANKSIRPVKLKMYFNRCLNAEL